MPGSNYDLFKFLMGTIIHRLEGHLVIKRCRIGPICNARPFLHKNNKVPAVDLQSILSLHFNNDIVSSKCWFVILFDVNTLFNDA